MLKENPVVKKMVALGEEQVGRLAQQLLSNERFVSAVQTLVGNTLRAKGIMDKNLRLALSAMNLPATADVEALKTKLEDLEDVISRLDDGVQRLAQKEAQREGSPDKVDMPQRKSRNASS
jgi:hypothetical protein